MDDRIKPFADLCGANLCGANLCGADLHGANLRGANLCGADLHDANLHGANLHGVNLYDANLCGADLRGADLRGANLRGANLCGANLHGADLRGANLYGANLRGAEGLSSLDLARLSIVPEDGSFIGWKKCRAGVIIKLLIPEDAKRSNSTGRKCRAERATVLEVIGAAVGESFYDDTFRYVKGETVSPHSWNPDRWTECGGGIHFFITRAEAEDWEG
jgi:hypothetical protein